LIRNIPNTHTYAVNGAEENQLLAQPPNSPLFKPVQNSYEQNAVMFFYDPNIESINPNCKGNVKKNSTPEMTGIRLIHLTDITSIALNNLNFNRLVTIEDSGQKRIEYSLKKYLGQESTTCL
jgi:hypothetical protein